VSSDSTAGASGKDRSRVCWRGEAASRRHWTGVPVQERILPAGRADMDIAVVIVLAIECPVGSRRLVEDRDMRPDPNHLGQAVGAVAGEPLRLEPEALGAFDHRARCDNLRLPDRAARFDVDDDRMIEICANRCAFLVASLGADGRWPQPGFERHNTRQFNRVAKLDLIPTS